MDGHSQGFRYRHRLFRNRRAARAGREVAALREDRILMGADTTHRTRRAALEASEPGRSTSWTAASRPTRTTIPSSTAFLRSSKPCVRDRSSVASMTGISFTPRPTSRTPSSRSSVHRPWSAPATSLDRVLPGMSSLMFRSKALEKWLSSRSGSKRIGMKRLT